MKTIPIFSAVVLLFLSLLPNNSSPQEQHEIVVVKTSAFPETLDAITNGSPIRIRSIEKVGTGILAKANEVPVKVLRAFLERFKDARDSLWYVNDKREKYFSVRFWQGQRKYHASYFKNGYLEYAVSEGSSKDFSKEESKAIMKDYFDYSISSAVEIITEENSLWTVRLQKGNKVIVVKLSDGFVEELANYTVPVIDEVNKKN